MFQAGRKNRRTVRPPWYNTHISSASRATCFVYYPRDRNQANSSGGDLALQAQAQSTQTHTLTHTHTYTYTHTQTPNFYYSKITSKPCALRPYIFARIRVFLYILIFLEFWGFFCKKFLDVQVKIGKTSDNLIMKT